MVHTKSSISLWHSNFLLHTLIHKNKKLGSHRATVTISLPVCPSRLLFLLATREIPSLWHSYFHSPEYHSDTRVSSKWCSPSVLSKDRMVYKKKKRESQKDPTLYLIFKSWGWAKKAVCSVAYLPKTLSVLHRLPDCLPSAGQNSPVCWRLSSWMLSGKSILLGNFGCELVAERFIVYGMKEFHSVTVQK